MPDSYSLTVVNDSEIPEPTFALFAALPLWTDDEILDVAWQTRQIDAGNQHVFTWQMAWGFAWAAQGADAGRQWTASGTLAADPDSTSRSKAELSYNGAFQLTPATSAPTGTTLWIADSPTVPLPSTQPSSVALTLGGSPATATNAGPNLFQTFTLRPTYYVDVGPYVQGYMVDRKDASHFQELTYPAGTTALTATFDRDNTWTVTTSSAVDFAALLAGRTRRPGRLINSGDDRKRGTAHTQS